MSLIDGLRITERRGGDGKRHSPGGNDTRTRILAFLTDCDQRGLPVPTIREIGDAVGLASSSSVKRQLDGLEASGYIRRRKSQPRSIVLVDRPKPLVDEATDRCREALKRITDPTAEAEIRAILAILEGGPKCSVRPTFR